MADEAQVVRFADGEGYERFMGRWSRAAGRLFLDWLSLSSKLKWLDVGCGTGAFTEIIKQSSGASEIVAIDPSAAQVSYAQSRQSAAGIQFQVVDARSMPFANERSTLRYRHWCSISSLTVKKPLPKCAASCEPAGLRQPTSGILPTVAVRRSICTRQSWNSRVRDIGLPNSMPKAQHRRI
jgi:SAM-dependent methyltransferase